MSVGKYNHLMLPFLNQCILILPIKTLGTIPLHIQNEIIHYNEMNDEISNIDMNERDIARNIIKLISFHLFHGQSKLTTYN
jgi:hypothetical protein